MASVPERRRRELVTRRRIVPMSATGQTILAAMTAFRLLLTLAITLESVSTLPLERTALVVALTALLVLWLIIPPPIIPVPVLLPPIVAATLLSLALAVLPAAVHFYHSIITRQIFAPMAQPSTILRALVLGHGDATDYMVEMTP